MTCGNIVYDTIIGYPMPDWFFLFLFFFQCSFSDLSENRVLLLLILK